MLSSGQYTVFSLPLIREAVRCKDVVKSAELTDLLGWLAKATVDIRKERFEVDKRNRIGFRWFNLY